MKRLYGTFMLLITFLVIAFINDGFNPTNSKSATNELPTIGILQTQAHPALDQIQAGILKELAQRGYQDGKTAHIKVLNAQGDQSNLKSMAEQLVALHADILIGIATPAAQALASSTTKIPIIMGAISDPVDAGLVKSLKQPGTNVTGVADEDPLDAQYQLITQLMPKLKTLGYLYTAGETQAQKTAKLLQKMAATDGIKVKTYTISNTNELNQVSQQMLQDVDAVYVPQDNNVAAADATLIKNANQAGIPIFPSAPTMVADGGLATVSQNQYDLGVLTGKVAGQFLKTPTKKAAETPVIVANQGELTLNTTTAKKLGLTIPTQLIKQAQTKGTVLP